MCAYVPTVPQVSQTVEALRDGGFEFVNAFEGLLRTWNVKGQSVRPDHRMVGHTGFLVTGRKVELRDGREAQQRRGRVES
jgi:tRNA (adenine57-N1/adenine58-N1)-methyltransferase